MSRETRDAPTRLIQIKDTKFPPLKKSIRPDHGRDKGGFLGFVKILELFLPMGKQLQDSVSLALLPENKGISGFSQE
jgi:hypothetical protein